MQKLNENDAATCEGRVNSEKTSAANRMKKETAPGYGGITRELMKVFWGKIGTVVTNSFYGSFRQRRILLHLETIIKV